MRASTTLAVAAAALLGNANALQLIQPRDVHAPRVIQHQIQRRHVENPLQRDRRRLRKRAGSTVLADLDNEETLYFMNATIGTPAQSLRLHIDTGSSDLWVNVASSQLCEEQSKPCAAAGTYAPNSSSTYEYLNSNFNITYVDGSGSAGDYVSDVVSFANVTLKDQEFGIGYTSSSAEGIVGIGYAANEVAASYGGQTYANVPQRLVQEGFIQSNAYSLWLNDLDASEGSILFGGVNTEKYTGTLQSMPIIKEEGVYAEFLIALTAVGENGTSGSIAKNVNSPALLDSGTSLMYLPNDITEDIYQSLGAEYDSSEGAAFVSCSMADSAGSIDLTFSDGPTISISLNELVIVAGVDRGQEICILGISPADGTTPVLGDTFLRSAYVVYDLYNNEIGLAQTNFNSTSDNILEITNSTSIPSASAVATAVTDVAVSTGGSRLNGETSGETTTAVAFAAPTAGVGYNQALMGALGVGVGIAAYAM